MAIHSILHMTIIKCDTLLAHCHVEWIPKVLKSLLN